MSRTETGVPFSVLSTIRRMSSSDRISPTPRMMYCSSPRDATFPPTVELLLRMASATASTERSNFRSLSGSTSTWYSCRYPPNELTSVTPGMPLRSGATIQSWIVRRSVSAATSPPSWTGRSLSSVYW